MTVASCLRKMQGRRVAVVGDAMLDAFLWGNATRISPEAPVPVLRLERQSWSLGGAANVAANIAALGGRPVLYSVVGTDAAGRRLRRLAEGAGIEIGALPAIAQRPTTVKYRALASSKHLLRIDRETTEPIPAAAERDLAAALEQRRDLEAVVVSDYAKGTVTTGLARVLNQVCTRNQLPWCVDPKRPELRYRRPTVLKPNLRELAVLSGGSVDTRAQMQRAAARVLRRHGCEHLLVTRGEQGMALFSADGSEQLLDGHGQAVADVTGAGDTVSAVVGLGLAAGLPVRQIAVLANRAGAYVVSQPGTAVARPEHLR